MWQPQYVIPLINVLQRGYSQILWQFYFEQAGKSNLWSSNYRVFTKSLYYIFFVLSLFGSDVIFKNAINVKHHFLHLNVSGLIYFLLESFCNQII